MTSFASESRPQTPPSFLVPHRRFESSRDLPRLQIPPLHVPDSPHGQHRQNQNQHQDKKQQQQQQQQQRSALRYTPPSSLPPEPQDSARFSQPSERSLLSTTSRSSSRGEGESSPAPPRARRFDPVREAASERSASQGTDTSTPPRIDTPHI